MDTIKELEICNRIINQDYLFYALTEKIGVSAAVEIFRNNSDHEIGLRLDELLDTRKE